MANVAPTLTVVGDQSTNEGSLSSLANLGSFTDPGYYGGEARRSRYTIDWGDGTPASQRHGDDRRAGHRRAC